jgi:signal transduction histidine kinase
MGSVMLWAMPNGNALLSTIRVLSDVERAEAERELVPIAREAALGRLAADVAHDVANPLFGVLGLVDLLLEDATPGSEDESRLRLLHQTTGEMKRTLQTLLDFARAEPGTAGTGDLVAACRTAIELVRHGVGKSLDLQSRYDVAALRVACGAAELVQLVLHLVLAARAADGAISVEVGEDGARVRPAGPEGLDIVIARRIAADHGGSVGEDAGAYVLRLPRS